MHSYDVIIVGGRAAGAALAARLGAEGHSVLVVDKATFPSPPSVPSCPLVYPQTMALLDEIGVDEAAWADGSVKVQRLVIEMGAWFRAPMAMIESRGRDYVRCIDRAVFDDVLWRHLARYPSVTTRSGFTVTDLVRDADGRVVGVEGRQDGVTERFVARCVVGADGRFSPVARRVGAAVVEDHPEHRSTVYFAEWEGVAPLEGEAGPQVHIYATARGTDVLFFPMPGGRMAVCTHQRADRVDTGGDFQAFHLAELQAHEPVRRRLAAARRVTDVVGMKRVDNRYRAAGGPGWVLVGDALHHKDPVDGQGIYDAFLEARLLAGVLGPHLDGELTWDDLVATYQREVVAETRPMFLATMDRLRTELYSEPPVPVIRTLIRWWMNDPEYQSQFMRFVCREVDPQRWRTPGMLLRAAVRGLLRDLVGDGWARRRPALPAN